MAAVHAGPDGPIFLAGVDRSGIGVLGEILECHPDVSMTRRTNFWSRYAGRFGDLRAPGTVDRCLDEMMRDRRMRALDPNRVRLQADLVRGELTYERLFELLQTQLMERRGRSRWGDKSLGAERFADRILAAYPTGSMIHVLRDPRDRYASQSTHRDHRRGGVGRGAALWRWSERLARRHSRRFPDRYRVVRYEDLVAEPDRLLDEVRRFLGLRAAAATIIGTPLTAASVGRHRRDLTSAERRYLELVLGRRMQRWGYEPDPPARGTAGAVSFWTCTVPCESVRATAWTGANALRPSGRAALDRRVAADPREKQVGPA